MTLGKEANVVICIIHTWHCRNFEQWLCTLLVYHLWSRQWTPTSPDPFGCQFEYYNRAYSASLDLLSLAFRLDIEMHSGQWLRNEFNGMTCALRSHTYILFVDRLPFFHTRKTVTRFSFVVAPECFGLMIYTFCSVDHRLCLWAFCHILDIN